MYKTTDEPDFELRKTDDIDSSLTDNAIKFDYKNLYFSGLMV